MHLWNPNPTRGWLLWLLLFCGVTHVCAEKLYTREYWLKNSDSSIITRAIDMAVRDPDKKRVVGGQGKHLVVTTDADQQSEIADLLPVFDQPTTETNPDKILMHMIVLSAAHLKQLKKEYVAQQLASPSLAPMNSGGPPAPVAASGPMSPLSGVNSFDLYKSTRSVYTAEDAKITNSYHIIEDEGALPPLGELTLKGTFKSLTGPPLALLSFGNTNYTARSGGLFERNRTRVKDVRSEVFKDKVILTGPDRIRREFKFKSTL